MTRLLLLLAAVFTFTACEQHQAEDLPEKLRKKDKHGAMPIDARPCCAMPSASTLLAAR